MTYYMSEFKTLGTYELVLVKNLKFHNSLSREIQLEFFVHVQHLSSLIYVLFIHEQYIPFRSPYSFVRNSTLVRRAWHELSLVTLPNVYATLLLYFVSLVHLLLLDHTLTIMQGGKVEDFSLFDLITFA